jgi:hypothetical protein
MRTDDFIVLLARQRSGTNALRSVLHTHKDICCLNEVFAISIRDTKVCFFPDGATSVPLSETSFFTFQEKYARGDVRKLAPDNHGKLFLDYLEYLRAFTPRRFIMMDVKYNSTHFLTEPFSRCGEPYLFRLIKEHRLRVINLTRKNFLRVILSQLKAERSGKWVVFKGQAPQKDVSVNVDVATLLPQLECYDAEDRHIENHFSAYDRYVTYEYEDVFPDSSGSVSPHVLSDISKWLGVENDYRNEANLHKQSSLPLSETIANFAEVRATLRGTRFEYCLEDEPAYRSPAKAAQSTEAAVGS